MGHNTFLVGILMKQSLQIYWGALICICSVTNALCAEPLVIDSVVLSPFQAAEVPAQQVGMLREILVDEGAVVEAGQVLAKLDTRQAELDVAKAEIEAAQAAAKAGNLTKVKYAEKSLEVAEAELKRSQESIAQFAKSISQSQIDVERLTVEKLNLEKKQAEHELDLDRFALRMKEQELAAAELKLEQHGVQAPFAGTVVLVHGRIGEWLEIGAPVLRLVAVESLRAEGFLAAEDAVGDMVGRDVVFRSETGKIAKGKLRFVSPEMDAVTRQVRVWAELENPDGEFRSGQQGSLEIAH
jgi:macrolide-specific efflux system membrane fusion protein